MSKTYRYSEIFYSFQGEAEMAGKPTVWLRFFGCNLECNGFGQKNPTDPASWDLPYKTFDISTVNKLEELPVWNTGCDSSYSWSAKYKKLVHNHTAAEICDLLTNQMRSPSNLSGDFVHPVTDQDTQLAFTGGEPMLNQPAMMEILREFGQRGNMPQTITVETNATKPLSAELVEFLEHEFFELGGRHWHWAMSPKLWNTAGEKDAVLPEIIQSYADTPATSLLKFVCDGTVASWTELDDHYTRIRSYFTERDQIPPTVWIMPVGATKDAQELPTVAEISLDAMRRGFNVATRNHCYVFGNVIGK